MDNKDYILKAIEEVTGEDILHYGTPRHSGRYPWGSGKNPQRSLDVISQSSNLRAKGLTKAEIAKTLGYKSTKSYTAAISQAHAARLAEEYRTIDALMEKHGGNVSAVGREMGRNESSIRTMLKQRDTRQSNIANSTVTILRNEMNRLNGEYLDVGKAANLAINVTESRLKTAVQTLVNEGKYHIEHIRIDNVDNSGNSTPTKVLVPNNVTWKDVVNHQERIHELVEAGAKVGSDGKIDKLVDPVSLDSKRIYINYTKDGKGGVEKDGTIEIRPGVKDLNLGNAMYAQVRVLVDDNKYMKGMAYYSKHVPEGYDCVYNTNKSTDKADEVFKEIKAKYLSEEYRPIDKFGAVIVNQNKYTDDNGQERTGVINIMRQEGAWSQYSQGLPSQFLSKQKVPVAKEQLAIDFAKRADDLATINSLTNPVLKQALLKPFADECDSAAVDLKAAAFPRQSWNVILPNPKLKDDEVYAPNFNTGEKICLIRFPHEGTYQIPTLTVNNNSRSSKEMIGSHPIDAICINNRVAERLSGADFDGDFVLAIPNNSGKITTHAAVKDLMEFDDKSAYPPIPGGKKAVVGKVEDPKTEYLWQEQKQMGMISNLITDMTLAGAPIEHLVRATKHSMTVIDVKKHNLDWKRSERENNIQELRNIYQKKDDPTKKAGGAGTLISRATSEERVLSRKPAYNLKDENGNYLINKGIDVKTGEKVWQPTGKKTVRWDPKTGEKIETPKTIKSTKMMEAEDARTLMSGPNHEGTEMEKVYADYANRCKALGNEARKSYVSITLPRRDPVAAKEYATEVKSLQEKLVNAQKNIPLERLAKIKAGLQIKALRAEGHDEKNASEWAKEKAKALARARQEVGATRYNIKIEPKEWEAIQKNAVSPTMLQQIFQKADLDQLKKLAMPKDSGVLSDAKISRIKAYANAGRTQQEIADSLGISVSSVRKALRNDEE